jgi:hypothetical protein
MEIVTRHAMPRFLCDQRSKLFPVGKIWAQNGSRPREYSRSGRWLRAAGRSTHKRTQFHPFLQSPHILRRIGPIFAANSAVIRLRLTRPEDGPDPQARWHVAPGLARPYIAPYSPEAARSLAREREAGSAGTPGRSAGEARAKRRTRRSGEAAGPSATDRPSPMIERAVAIRFLTSRNLRATRKRTSRGLGGATAPEPQDRGTRPVPLRRSTR